VTAAIEKGRELPSWYLDEPSIDEVDAFFLRAFWDLNTERGIGMGEGRIPWSKIVGYGLYFELRRDTIDTLVHVVKSLDNTYLAWGEKNRPK
jgi:hypothetical protein